MKTTVIIPTFNRAEMLGRAIHSLLLQRNDVDLDILVIDDASTDGTSMLLRTLSATHPQIRVLRHDVNLGPSQARNSGLACLLPDTAVVTFLDSDDLSPIGRFAADLPILLNNPCVELTYGRMMIIDAIDPRSLAPLPGARQLELRGIHLSAGLYRRRLVERIGLIDTALKQAEDTDYLLRIFEANATFVETDTLCLYYYRHGSNTTSDNAESRRWFAAALLRSMQRRKLDPSIVLRTPDFMIKPLSAQELL